MITNTVAYLLLGGLLALVGLIAAVIYEMRNKPPSKKLIYVSPERKQAMIDAGVWDDHNSRLKYLKAHQAHDDPKSAPLPVDVRVKLETPPAKGGRPKGSKNKKRLGRPKGSKTKIKKAIRSRA
jgi:hypothetical protein